MIAEGNSLRSTSRMAGASINTVTKLLGDVGAACSAYQDRVFRNLSLKRTQCDDIWSFVYAKQEDMTPAMPEGGHAGEVWTWTAIDAETKLVPSWRVGTRDAQTAAEFINDLASRLANHVQLMTDGHKAYLATAEGAFRADADHATLVGLYGQGKEGEPHPTPPQCIAAISRVVAGEPNPRNISTSHVERQRLATRVCMRRFTRLTDGFSKKLENYAAAVALHFMYYNFARIHSHLGMTPAMAAGVSDHLWGPEEIALLGQ